MTTDERRSLCTHCYGHALNLMCRKQKGVRNPHKTNSSSVLWSSMDLRKECLIAGIVTMKIATLQTEACFRSHAPSRQETSSGECEIAGSASVDLSEDRQKRVLLIALWGSLCNLVNMLFMAYEMAKLGTFCKEYENARAGNGTGTEPGS
ncbi:hypothetical protein LSAT2_014253 [Lamellibrachia satsuma]|nr:hypothetical protein LSAT2_014253 [Lamellibrachia satsuma]